jgi:hypothetical protein
MRNKSASRPWWRLHPAQLVFLALFGLFFGFSVYNAWENNRKLSSYLPVEVTIVGVAEDLPPGSPAARFGSYRYEVGGVMYESSKVRPTYDSRSKASLGELRTRYIVGKTYTGYYNPAAPGDSFLERSTSLQPYCVMVMAVPMLLLPAILIGRSRRTASQPAPAPAVESRRTLQVGMLIAGGLLLVSLCFAVSSFGAFTPSAGSPPGSASTMRGLLAIFALVIGLMGALAGFFSWEHWRTSQARPAAGGWHQLRPSPGHWGHLLLLSSFAAMWNLPIGFFASVLASRAETKGLWCMLPFGLAGAGLLVASARQAWVALRAGSMRAEISRARLGTGDSAALRVSYQPRRPVAGMEARLIARRKRRNSTAELYNKPLFALADPVGGAGWQGAAQVKIPSRDAEGQRLDGRLDWFVEVTVRPERGPSERLGFPLTVGNQPAGSR